MRKQTPEGQLTSSIRQLLKTFGIFHWKAWGGPMSAPGVPDIVGCWKGRMIGIEVKAPRGHLSPDQVRFIEAINRSGGLAFVARSLDDVIENLELGDRFLVR